KDSPFDLVAYTDSDYAGASLDRKSTTGVCQFLGCRLISWQCKKQTMVANSTTEDEYISSSNYYGQVLWIQNQLMDYGYNFMQTKIHIDNESNIRIVNNPIFHTKTKHIEIRHHFIIDSNEKKLIQMRELLKSYSGVGRTFIGNLSKPVEVMTPILEHKLSEAVGRGQRSSTRTSWHGNMKGKDGIYTIGFTLKGLFGALVDAERVAVDLECNGALTESIYAYNPTRVINQVEEVSSVKALKQDASNEERSLSAQTLAARASRRKISEKTQELGKLIPDGQKMNTAEMFQAAFKYVRFLQASHK
ncbi:putative ribonuclease H-like domain-containing protein, partial [Tanacetum coccineum]